MKGKTLKAVMGGLVALIASVSFGQAPVQTTGISTSPHPVAQAAGAPGLGKQLAQKALDVAAQANTPIPTAAEVLANIESEIAIGKIPATIYPPGYLDHLQAMGNQPMYTLQQFDPTAAALKPGDKANMRYMDPTFIMGSPTSEAERQANGTDETQHTVTITYGFYISQYLVSQGEYLAIIGGNPSFYTGNLNRPVEQVSWSDATNYCGQLTAQALAAGTIPAGWAYRLPTEAEYEYSSRAGTTTAFSFGTSIHQGDANFDTYDEYDASIGTIYVPGNTPLGMTSVVGNYAGNQFGLYDMQGNVDEWCQDIYGPYPTGNVIDPQGATSGSLMVIRGGYYGDQGNALRAAYRTTAGAGITSPGIGFRTVLAPIVPPWRTAIATTPSATTYGGLPSKAIGKDSLIFITHGAIPPGDDPAIDTAWVDSMSNSIQSYLNSDPSLNNWQVYGYKWTDKAEFSVDPLSPKFGPEYALGQAIGEGTKVGKGLQAQGWANLHLIAHSAGSGLIQAITDVIKPSSTTVHCTFLDPFVGLTLEQVNRYGNGADWSDQYFSHGVPETGGSVGYKTTDSPLPHAYNVNVTQLNKVRNYGAFVSDGSGVTEPCYHSLATHSWAIDFYSNTITANVTSDYDGFGFPLSQEGGQWGSISSYTRGNGTPGNIEPVQILGTPDDNCISFSQVDPQTLLNVAVASSPSVTSGDIQLYENGHKDTTHSPAWIDIVINATNVMNFASFDAEFLSAATNAQGLLTVYWDTNIIGSVDEQAVQPGQQHYTFAFPATAVNSTHMFGFRIDPFTNVQSVVLVTNIALGMMGPSQPFSLSLTTNTGSDGSRVYELDGQSGFDYMVDGSTDLVNWETVAAVVNTNGAVRFFEPGSSTNYSQRFYRAMSPYSLVH